MQLGMIGLGKMGANMTTRLILGGHAMVVFDHNADAIAASAAGGAVPAASLAEIVQKLDVPRTVWVMVPSGDPTLSTVRALADLMQPGDTIIDGGNSFYGNSVMLGQELAAKGLHFIDVGTSGGVWGLENGYSLMIGGDEAAVARTPFSRRLHRRQNWAGDESDRPVRAITLRWCITASNMA